jgi:hypothetical protein
MEKNRNFKILELNSKNSYILSLEKIRILRILDLISKNSQKSNF